MSKWVMTVIARPRFVVVLALECVVKNYPVLTTALSLFRQEVSTSKLGLLDIGRAAQGCMVP
jgi:hypothetical protein